VVLARRVRWLCIPAAGLSGSTMLPGTLFAVSNARRPWAARSTDNNHPGPVTRGH
jgi:hypothetical protein